MATRSISGVPESITKDLKLQCFKIHELSETGNHSVAHGRRDFYKIDIVTGNMAGSHSLAVTGHLNIYFFPPNLSLNPSVLAEKIKLLTFPLL